jgi:hypothetical protein
MNIDQLVFPLAKAEYLLTYTAEPGEGGDKRRFWRILMGFQSPITLREALINAVSTESLQPAGDNDFGSLYQAVVLLTGPSGVSRPIQTVWIVLSGENVARFVTAYPA